MAEDRKKYAQMMFSERPEFFPEHRRQAILNGIVLVGMTPFEAQLAGGSMSYKVIRDEDVWTDPISPLEIIKQQSVKPDKSKIWLHFKNDTQFNGLEFSFVVFFEDGSAKTIEVES